MSTRTKRLGCTVAIVAALALGACGGGGTKTTEGKSSTVRTAAGATSTSSSKSKSLDPVHDYFQALATNTVQGTQHAIDLAQPGSIAAAYTTTQHNYLLAAQTSGQSATSTPPETLKSDVKSVTMCQPTGTTATTSTVNPCTTYTDFVSDKGTKKLAQFKADGQDLQTRIVLGNGQPAPGGAIVATLLSGYQSVQSGYLFVVLTVQNTGTVPYQLELYSANYVGPDGTQQSAVTGGTAQPAGALQPGAKATVGMAFANAAVGGNLTFGALGAAPSYDQANVTVKVG